MVGGIIGATQTMIASNSSHYVFPFVLNQDLSCSYMRMPASFNLVSTSFATTANSSTTFSQVHTAFMVVYSAGVGASSRSLQYVTSGSAGWTWQVSGTIGNTNSRWSVTNNFTFPSEGNAAAVFTSSYPSSLTRVDVLTTGGMTDMAGWKYLDIPFAASLDAGNYWMALMHSSASAGGKANGMSASTIVLSQVNTAIGALGAANNASHQLQIGLGSWSTNAINTTSSIGLAAISSVASQLRPYIQFVRQA